MASMAAMDDQDSSGVVEETLVEENDGSHESKSSAGTMKADESLSDEMSVQTEDTDGGGDGNISVEEGIVEQGERGERGERRERGDRGDREERGERSERGERGDRRERGERGDRSERGLRGERGERGDNVGRDSDFEEKPDIVDEIVDSTPGENDVSVLLKDNFSQDCSNISHPSSKEMYLYNKSFTASMEAIGRFVNLKVLKLFSNQKALLPAQVGELTKWGEIFVKSDSSSLLDLPSSEALELHQVPLRPSRGFFPKDIGQLKLLKKLSVCHFSLTSVPAEVGELTSLEELDLSFNSLATLPGDITNLTALSSLNLSNNYLDCFPSGLAKLLKLRSLDVSSNKLTSFQGLDLSSMTSLTTLNAQNNKFGKVDEIPVWINCNIGGNDWLRLGNKSSDVSESKEDSRLSSPKCTSRIGRIRRLRQKPPGGDSLDNLHWEARQERLRLSRSNDCNQDIRNELTVKPVTQLGRRQGYDVDKNPKPNKRRRWVLSSSDVSYKYYRESFCGFEDRLHDGFYDAGRHRPFKPLEFWEKEGMLPDPREILVVDRARDEELDVTISQAMDFLNGGYCPGTNDVKQRATMLAIFVSERFGGSDKSLNTKCARLSALGKGPREEHPSNESKNAMAARGLPGCTCGFQSRRLVTRRGEGGASLLSAIPSVQSMCEESVRFLRMQLGSNVIPIGAINYGICRHRAILYKYLCDRAEPVIPCELVRGFMDNIPHAWNVILAETPTGTVRFSVDVCRPHALEREDDPSHIARYLPLRSMDLPQYVVDSFSDGHFPVPIMHEEIGRGASGAVVRRCSLGDFTLAAKVAICQLGNIPPLNEVLMLRSLPRHPCLVKFYGHSLRFLSGTHPVEELALFLEYVAGGSLKDMLFHEKEAGNHSLPVPLAVHIAKKVAEGLSVLHRRGIMHRDIKSANVLVDCWDTDNQPPVKVCDFSCAVSVFSSSEHTCSVVCNGAPPMDVCVGTPRWMAPEVLRASYGRHLYGLEGDIWSFGCVLLEMLSLQIPYEELSDSDARACIQMAQRPRLPPRYKQLYSSLCPSGDLVSEETRALQTLVKLFYHCTEASPKDRPTADSLVQQLSSCLDSLSPQTYSGANIASDDVSTVIDTDTGDEEVVESRQETESSSTEKDVEEETKKKCGSSHDNTNNNTTTTNNKSNNKSSYNNNSSQRPASPKSNTVFSIRSLSPRNNNGSGSLLCPFTDSEPEGVVEDPETASTKQAPSEDQDLIS